MGRTTLWLSGLGAALGLWLVAVPFVFSVGWRVARWNHFVSGGLIVLASGYAAAAAARGWSGRVRAATLVAVLGGWTVAAPFLLGFPDQQGVLNDVVVGAVVATVGSYQAYLFRAY